MVQPLSGKTSHERLPSRLGQRIWHQATNVLVGVFIIATVVSNVREISMSIVANCLRSATASTKVVDMQPSKRQLLFQKHSTAAVQVVLALTILFAVPLVFWMGSVPADGVCSFLRQIEIGWDSVIHHSIWPLVAVTLVRALIVAHQSKGTCDHYNKQSCGSSCDDSHRLKQNVVYIGLYCFVTTVIVSQLQIINPSWAWNPFLLGRLTVYKPNDIRQLLQGICLDFDPNSEDENRQPLCLSPQSWRSLGGEVLDPSNANDVDAVVRGVKYARDESGGLIVNIMSRDTIDAIDPLRENVEGLLPFFEDKLSVVVFENDSVDGSREAFKKWAEEAKGYKVDLISCGEENPDCKFHMSHRYDSTEAQDYFKSSAIGKMAEFRQKIVDHVLSSPEYKDYSHMLAMDLDLKVSISPLGVLHSLGSMPENAVASSGRQAWPGSLGTLMPPYDFSAFRALENPTNKNMLWLHEQFCALMPPGDRWRNQCDAVSPMQLMLVLGHDWLMKDQPYEVRSAFNGATLYPIPLIRETGAKYDSGDDGQRCEHIGFNLAFKRQMYINPKWNFFVAPENPGGPTGFRALRSAVRIFTTPRLSLVIGAQAWFGFVLFVYSIMILGVHLLYPLLCGLGILRRKSSNENSSLPLTQDNVSTFNRSKWPVKYV